MPIWCAAAKWDIREIDAGGSEPCRCEADAPKVRYLHANEKRTSYRTLAQALDFARRCALHRARTHAPTFENRSFPELRTNTVDRAFDGGAASGALVQQTRRITFRRRADLA